tara:strand:- start:11090 stop:11458 length:369 start_codon:yes stop_codon:yes gene_type:complete
MNNYNVDYECTYINSVLDTDDKYREELLKVFNLDKTDTSDELTKKVDELYDDTKLQFILNDIFKLLREKVPFLSICKDDFCFMFLFGYETFYIMQKVLREYKSKNNISKETLDELKDKIEYI